MAEIKEEMLSTGKVATKLGVSPAKIKKIIQELELEPDMKKGNCAYYGEAAQKKIVSKL